MGEKTDSVKIGTTEYAAMLNPKNAYVDGDELTVTAVDNSVEPLATGKYGQLYWNSDGSYIFVNDLEATAKLAYGDTAIQQFSFTVTDPFGLGNTAYILIEIIGVNDPPVANPVYYRTEEYNALTETVSGGKHITHNDYDVDSEVFSVTLIEEHIEKSANINRNNGFGHFKNEMQAEVLAGKYGELHWNADGSFTYFPDTVVARMLPEGKELIETFVYTITDDWDSTAASMIYITITGKNNALLPNPIRFMCTIAETTRSKSRPACCQGHSITIPTTRFRCFASTGRTNRPFNLITVGYIGCPQAGWSLCPTAKRLNALAQANKSDVSMNIPSSMLGALPHRPSWLLSLQVRTRPSLPTTAPLSWRKILINGLIW
jgi:VCBS repeat-containing protein